MIEFTGKELDYFLRKIKKERSGECYATSNSREKMMSSKLFEDGLINLQEISNGEYWCYYTSYAEDFLSQGGYSKVEHQALKKRYKDLLWAILTHCITLTIGLIIGWYLEKLLTK